MGLLAVCVHACSSQSFLPRPFLITPSVLLPLIVDSIPNLLPCTYITRLCLQTLDKVFLAHKPRTTSPTLDSPRSTTASSPRYLLPRALLGPLPAPSMYTIHPGSPTPVRPIMSNSKAHLYGFIGFHTKARRGPVSCTGRISCIQLIYWCRQLDARARIHV